MAKTVVFTTGPLVGQEFKFTKLRLLSDGLPLHATGRISEGRGTYLITDSNEVIDGVRRINIDLTRDEFVNVTIELDMLKAELHYLDETEPFRLIRAEDNDSKSP